MDFQQQTEAVFTSNQFCVQAILSRVQPTYHFVFVKFEVKFEKNSNIFPNNIPTPNILVSIHSVLNMLNNLVRICKLFEGRTSNII